MLWVPVKINCSRGVFKQPPLVTHIENIAKHVEVIQTEGNVSSRFIIVATAKDRVCYHTLVSVRTNGQVYPMK
jgi:hypothetical protein